MPESLEIGSKVTFDGVEYTVIVGVVTTDGLGKKLVIECLDHESAMVKELQDKEHRKVREDIFSLNKQ